MSKSFVPGVIGLVVIIGGLRQSSSAEDPAKAKKRRDSTTAFSRTHLGAMKEPSLRELAENDRTATVYRFLWLPTFHNPVAVRFVKSDEGAVLHAVRLSGKGGYEPEKIVERKSVKLGRAPWERIVNHLDKAKFWTLPSSKPPPFGEINTDGDMLIVEGVKDGKYHVVRRHSPTGGDFVDLCRAMLFMSGMDVRRLSFEYR
jgi:hypothetical protein